MFGYVKIFKDELKVREYGQYKAAYCGVCLSLKKKYGKRCGALLSFDMTFLALLLGNYLGVENTQYRCLVRPGKKSLCYGGAAMDFAADCSVLLAREKILDDTRDAAGLRRVVPAVKKIFFRRAFRKASARQPEIAAAVTACSDFFAAAEKNPALSPDAIADGFATLLKTLRLPLRETPTERPAGELLYHVGRFIYYLDALDDLRDDFCTHSYNPWIARFRLSSAELSPEQIIYIKNLLCLSLDEAAKALAIMETGQFTLIISNIICLGMPSVMENVFAKFPITTEGETVNE